jgi:hypothetical protein
MLESIRGHMEPIPSDVEDANGFRFTCAGIGVEFATGEVGAQIMGLPPS